MRTSTSAVLATAGLLTLAACGGGTTTPTTTPDADLVVRARDGVVWDRKEYTVSAADGSFTLYTVNDSGIAHNLHIQDANGIDQIVAINLPKKGSNGTAEVSLSPGEYRIVCLIPSHSATMNSSLTVEG